MMTHSTSLITDLVEQVGSLPSVAAQVVGLASDPDCDIREMTKVITCDNAMTLRFLALVNSPAVSCGHEIKDLRSALVRLGMHRVRNMALLMGIHDLVPVEDTPSELDLAAFWKYSLATASCARALAWLRCLPQGEENAWLVGILHGLGIATFNQKSGPEFQQALQMARSEEIPLAEAEMRIFDLHHGQLGAHLLRNWNLPRIFVDTVEYYPNSNDDNDEIAEALPMIRVLRDAILTARTIGFGDNGDGDPLPSPGDLPTRLHLTPEALDAIAEKVDKEVGEISSLIGLDMSSDAFASTLNACRKAVAHLGLVGLDEGLERENLERQLTSAREIQQRLLPETLPRVPRFELHAANSPSLHVSGDTYDFVQLSDGRMAAYIADVSGKGMAAALLASTVQATVRALARVMVDLGELLAAINEALFEATDPEHFATLFLGALAIDGHSLQYVSAGHNPPLLLRADQSAEWLPPAGTPVGMIPGMTYPVHEVPLFPGDLLVTYTDGITEAVNSQDEEFGEEGLEKVVRASRNLPPSEIIEAIMAGVRKHVTGDQDQSLCEGLLNLPSVLEDSLDVGDDLTVVVLRKKS